MTITEIKDQFKKIKKMIAGGTKRLTNGTKDLAVESQNKAYTDIVIVTSI